MENLFLPRNRRFLKFFYRSNQNLELLLQEFADEYLTLKFYDYNLHHELEYIHLQNYPLNIRTAPEVSINQVVSNSTGNNLIIAGSYRTLVDKTGFPIISEDQFKALGVRHVESIMRGNFGDEYIQVHDEENLEFKNLY